MVYAYLPDELYYTENSGEYERGNLLPVPSLPSVRDVWLLVASPHGRFRNAVCRTEGDTGSRLHRTAWRHCFLRGAGCRI